MDVCPQCGNMLFYVSTFCGAVTVQLRLSLLQHHMVIPRSKPSSDALVEERWASLSWALRIEYSMVNVCSHMSVFFLHLSHDSVSSPLFPNYNQNTASRGFGLPELGRGGYLYLRGHLAQELSRAGDSAERPSKRPRGKENRKTVSAQVVQ